MRVSEYLPVPCMKGVPNPKVRSAVDAAMETCDLARTARRKIIGTLSRASDSVLALLMHCSETPRSS